MQTLLCSFLDVVERIIMNIPFLRDWILYTHESAIRQLFSSEEQAPQRIVVIGGGIFPRTAIIMKKLFPESQIIIQDMNEGSLKLAENYLRKTNNEGNIYYFNSMYDGTVHGTKNGSAYGNCSGSIYGTIMVFPLAFRGMSINSKSPYKTVKHCWIWENEPCVKQCIVSYFLMKKVIIPT